jgi:hypothetical protein
MIARRDFFWRGVSALGFAMGAAALGISLLLWSRGAEKPAQSAAAPPVAPQGHALAGKTGTLSRLLADRRAVARIQFGFRPNGALDASCRAETADGAESACFGDEKGTSTWSLQGTRLCLVAPAINLRAESCYELSGEAPSLQLAGSGFLAGNMMLR